MSRNNSTSTFSYCAAVGLSMAALYLAMIEPTFAASIDLSPVQEFLQSIVGALTGTLGKTAATLAVVGTLLTWFFGIIDFRQLLWIVVAIVCIGSAATIVDSLWGAK